MKNQFLTIIGLTTALSLAASTQSFAGQWHSDINGWWWQNDDGTYPASTWQWIDGNNDGSSECYYFTPEGYCVISGITPDGYTVDGTGAWIMNGIVQIQQNTATVPSNSSKLAEAQKLLERIPYYGDPNQCTMTAEQARAYIQLLKDGVAGEMPIPPGHNKVLSRRIYWDQPFSVEIGGSGGATYDSDRNAVMLGDFAGDGNPFLYLASSRVDSSFEVYGWTNRTIKLAANEEGYGARLSVCLFEDSDGTVKMYEYGSGGAVTGSDTVLSFSNGKVGTEYYLLTDGISYHEGGQLYTYKENNQLMDFTAEKEAYMKQKAELAQEANPETHKNHSHRLSTPCFYQIKPCTIAEMISYLEQYAELME